ncbi:MAG TPA: elongation factor P maturation arginine rhamnosyltransferase EarP [Paenalcaligenes sp.]|nr:elongation factor P maturation arginine rhamnosyltransferase EarP [Paenalcaligenes sp.]HLR83249.1 elongation factor P maturation arginine rhamnosyltransferase EarP [Paenalcaligenes sp.]
MLKFDIFCRVIDHFGDAGVCWRLAKELSGAPFYAEVRLWIDDLPTLQKITAQNNQITAAGLPSNASSGHRKLTVHPWPAANNALENSDWPKPHPIVIEAFAGGIPAAVRTQLTADHLWIVLDHLSAEKWVSDFHGLPGYADGLQAQKYYFYPGFTENTGGLLRQPDLLSQVQYWQSQTRLTQWQRLAIPLQLDPTSTHQLASSTVFFIFQYPHAPVSALLQSLLQQEPIPPTTILFAADQDVHYQNAQQLLRSTMPDSSEPAHLKPASTHAPTINLIRLPFVSQQHFDHLLWSTDFNFVRGEDSWVRALWAQRPFIWQPYPQSECTHLIKLRAWLQRLDLPYAAQKLFWQWNSNVPQRVYTHNLDITALAPAPLRRWQQCIRHEVHRLRAQEPLSSHLIQFCRQKLNSH